MLTTCYKWPGWSSCSWHGLSNSTASKKATKKIWFVLFTLSAAACTYSAFKNPKSNYLNLIIFEVFGVKFSDNLKVTEFRRQTKFFERTVFFPASNRTIFISNSYCFRENNTWKKFETPRSDFVSSECIRRLRVFFCSWYVEKRAFHGAEWKGECWFWRVENSVVGLFEGQAHSVDKRSKPCS